MSTSNQELDRNLKTFKKYKNLLKELTAKNVKLKYRNSWLGILWSFIQPLLQMIVLSVVFGGIFGRSNKHVICFPVYLFTGRLLFSFFTSSTKQAMTSFRRNAGIIKKVYVPQGTTTISNLGSVYREQKGLCALLEIIPPQTTAFAINAAQKKPIVVTDENGNDKIEIRLVLPITIAIDHRALDYGDVVPFMRKLDEIFDNPAIIQSWK